ncbi:SMI1/KNR4 family protein [Burkholderia thailandensis]|uniref:SMI1/KNR4 family protein n=1 Tax=Burkholderia thailandensis TaxID=57975 RepID=UPI0022AC09F3|nr:SMI1/KNR4 family protein [Burkholderia thailandensis]MCZ2903321.1 SMI1/KNR4 family protein [Burkholderia thailandensis]MDD1484314.1 SMI1/KNR4 family protein [Burkholderia thailandensis]MDD1490298.1 SMI1/KNR4 family protein [Burkholderia thailandensis]MDD1496516.1 SMI1/KNR4 family protein [Burkholderia thailandensis]
MSIAELVDRMTSELNEANRPRARAETEIAAADLRFAAEFGVALPTAYKVVLRHADGVLHNGLTIWPLEAHALFRQTLFEANADLRDSFDSRFVYLGQRDEELYVFETAKQRYCAIEFVGKPVWVEFRDDTEMFEFMLERAWE